MHAVHACLIHDSCMHCMHDACMQCMHAQFRRVGYSDKGKKFRLSGGDPSYKSRQPDEVEARAS